MLGGDFLSKKIGKKLQSWNAEGLPRGMTFSGRSNILYSDRMERGVQSRDAGIKAPIFCRGR